MGTHNGLLLLWLFRLVVVVVGLSSLLLSLLKVGVGFLQGRPLVVTSSLLVFVFGRNLDNVGALEHGTDVLSGIVVIVQEGWKKDVLVVVIVVVMTMTVMVLAMMMMIMSMQGHLENVGVKLEVVRHQDVGLPVESGPDGQRRGRRDAVASTVGRRNAVRLLGARLHDDVVVGQSDEKLDGRARRPIGRVDQDQAQLDQVRLRRMQPVAFGMKEARGFGIHHQGDGEGRTGRRRRRSSGGGNGIAAAAAASAKALLLLLMSNHYCRLTQKRRRLLPATKRCPNGSDGSKEHDGITVLVVGW